MAKKKSFFEKDKVFSNFHTDKDLLRGWKCLEEFHKNFVVTKQKNDKGAILGEGQSNGVVLSMGKFSYMIYTTPKVVRIVNVTSTQNERTPSI